MTARYAFGSTRAAGASGPRKRRQSDRDYDLRRKEEAMRQQMERAVGDAPGFFARYTGTEEYYVDARCGGRSTRLHRNIVASWHARGWVRMVGQNERGAGFEVVERAE